MSNKEKALEYQKGLMYIMGTILLVCGIILLAIIKKGSGSFFPESGEPVAVYLMAYGAVGLGIFFWFRGRRTAAEAEVLRSQPVRTVRARVHAIDTSQMTANRTAMVDFKVESGSILRLYQEGSFTYIEGDVGQLKYKGVRVMEFDYED